MGEYQITLNLVPDIGVDSGVGSQVDSGVDLDVDIVMRYRQGGR